MSGIIGTSPNMNSGVLGEYPKGQIIQIVSSENSYHHNTTSNSLIDLESSSGNTWLNRITPSSYSNKIYVQYCLNMGCSQDDGADGRGTFVVERLVDSSWSEIFDGQDLLGLYQYDDGQRGTWEVKLYTTGIMDSFSTTTEATYRVKFKKGSNADAVWCNNDGRKSFCNLMEISA